MAERAPRLALDTNVLAYAEGLARVAADVPKIATARRLVGGLGGGTLVLPCQVIAELHAVLMRKGGFSAKEASRRVRRWGERARLIDTTASVLDAALDLAAEHSVPIFDAVILAAAVDSRCDLLVSEDFQDGFAWRGVAVANPFAAAPDPRLARLSAGG